MTRSAPIRRTPVRLAWTALLWERSAPVLAGPVLAAGLFAALALWGVFDRTGDPWRLIAALGLVLAAGVAVNRTARRFRWPTRADAERRVEADSGLSGRPYEALADAPVAGAGPLWDAHRARMAAQLGAARARRPRAAWGRVDPMGGRIALVVVMIGGVGLAGEAALPRLLDALSPRLLAGGGAGATIEFWIEPPAYTGLPVQYLRDRRDADLPEGSVLAARLAGFRRDPAVSGAPHEIEALGPDVRQIAIRPIESGVVTVRAGAMRERLALRLVEDAPPVLRLAGEPEGDAQGRLTLEFIAEDDYGVVGWSLELAPAPEDGSAPEEFETLAVSPGDVGAPDADGVRRAVVDVSRSPYAGERAVIRLAGVDGAGQSGVTGPLTLTLPRRVFLDPLAKAVADERRRFLLAETAYAPMPETAPASSGFLGDDPERRIERAPPEVRRMAAALDAVSDAPPAYFDDPIVWAGLRTAMRETRRAREMADLSHLDEDLWQIALRAELGGLADAEEALRAAQRALNDALARGADALELSALFDAYDEAVRRYMQALAREAVEEGRFADGGGGGALGADQLQALLDALREAAELGDTEGSRRALEQLQALLENLQMQIARGGGGEGEPGEESLIERALREALEELGATIGDQRSVMEDTFNEDQGRSGSGAGASRRSGGDPQGGMSPDGRTGADGEQGSEAGGESRGETGGGPGAAPGAESGGGGESEGGGDGGGDGEDDRPGRGMSLAERQAAIAEGLDALGDALGESAGPEARASLDDAARQMDAARQALDSGDGERALAAQDRALSALRDAASAAAERLESERGGQGQAGTDPAGRALGSGGGAGAGAETGVPGEAERQRARDILEELRRRAAERGRPQEELDYIDRLLDRF